MSSSQFETFLGRSAGRPSPASPPAPAAEAGPADAYQAWSRFANSNGDYLLLRSAQGDEEAIFRPYIRRVRSRRGGTIVTLLADDGAIVLSGRGLGELPRLWMQRQFDVLHEFDADRWPLPAAGTPVITRIDWLDGQAGRGATANSAPA
jgi:hypothetical protein